MEKVIDLGKAFDMIHETDGKVIDLGKAFDMIHETDGKGHWFGKGIWYDSWNIPPLYTEILHTSDATKRSRSCTQKLVSIYS